MNLPQEKVQQAVGILRELGIDAWLTFVRETTESGDPVLPVILGHPLTWQSALLITSNGDRIAMVGRYEDAAVRSVGAWEEVVPYVEGLRAPLREVLGRIAPNTLAINYALNDVKADGLTHGMFLLLQQHLEGLPCADRFCSAEPIVVALRGRKTETEIARIRAAIDTTNAIMLAMADHARPGRTEVEIAGFMRDAAAGHGVDLAWEPTQCPIVTTGPDSMVGHGVPSARLSIEPGRLFHVDFGVRQDGFCSDVQRAWYVPGPEEREVPDAVERGFRTIVRAIEAAARTLAPGVEGHLVDAAARRVIVEAGYPEYQHATGHQVGRAAHDGGCVLGPTWERYGDTPRMKAEPGNVFTLELGIDNLDGRGYLGLEEMVLVTDRGCEFLTAPQRTLPTLGAAWARVC